MDLNLVRTFVTIYEARSLTRAAEQLHVTPPAISQGLGRLRAELDDPLFDRAGREMQPNSFAQSIFLRFRAALAEIDQAIAGAREFDALATDRVFRIALSELGEIGWLPLIARAVHSAAPLARVDVLPLDPDGIEDALSRGTVDLAITPTRLAGAFERSHVKSQPYAVATTSSRRHRARVLDRIAYADAAHVAVASDTGAMLLDAARRDAGIVVQPTLTVQHFATLPPLLVAVPELVATIPSAIAAGWATAWPITATDLPFAMEPIELSLYRRRSAQQSTALDWFHETVARAIEGSGGDFASLAGG